MKSPITIVLFVLVAFLFGCATNGKNIPKQLPDALNAACDLYSKAKPQVIAAREYAKQHWDEKVPGTDRDLIPADVKKILLELDSYLPELDKAGLALCSAAEGVNTFQTIGNQGGKIDWNQVLTIVMKGASIALDLKAKGAI